MIVNREAVNSIWPGAQEYLAFTEWFRTTLAFSSNLSYLPSSNTIAQVITSKYSQYVRPSSSYLSNTIQSWQYNQMMTLSLWNR